MGVTPSAWESSYKAFQFGAGSAFVAGRVGAQQNRQVFFGIGASHNGTNWLYTPTGVAVSNYTQTDGAHQWFNAPSGTAGNAITFTQAMTLTAAGNLLLGTTTGNGLRLDFSPTSDQQQNGITYVQSSPNTFTDIYGAGTAGGWAGAIRFFTSNSATAAERARIDSSGNLLVGRTSNGLTNSGAGINKNAGGAFFEAVQSGNGVACMYLNQSNGTGTQTVADFRYSNTQVGTINVTSIACTYNNLSDYRLKTVVGNVTGHGARIDALEPVEYTWNSNGTRTRGFLAHKFQEVYEQSVTGTKDAVDADGKPVYQSMQASTSEVIADLVAEIQSLRVRVAQLETN